MVGTMARQRSAVNASDSLLLDDMDIERLIILGFNGDISLFDSSTHAHDSHSSSLWPNIMDDLVEVDSGSNGCTPPSPMNDHL
jgi:hypothetical protein